MFIYFLHVNIVSNVLNLITQTKLIILLSRVDKLSQLEKNYFVLNMT